MSKTIPSGFRQRVCRRLMAWFDRQARDMPWRRTRDPYKIWVSEVMLQQTQVAVVIPYYRRFIKSFPTIKALAAAEEQDVLRHWQGLGYYRRASNLHKAARILTSDHVGHFPNNPDVVSKLPGIGRYTLGAVLSQAFDHRLPSLETNTVRVLTRLFAIRQPPSHGATTKRLWRLAETLLPAKRVGCFNQALMELGQVVCTAAAPACLQCPLAELCAARRLQIQEQLPRRQKPQKTTFVQEVAVVVRRGSRVLIVQRPKAGRWANLWEFPRHSIQPGESIPAAAMRMLRALSGITAKFKAELTTLSHTVTRYSIKLTCCQADYRAGEFRSVHYQQGRWIDPQRLSQLPCSSPQRQLAQVVVQTMQRSPC